MRQDLRTEIKKCIVKLSNCAMICNGVCYENHETMKIGNEKQQKNPDEIKFSSNERKFMFDKDPLSFL